MALGLRSRTDWPGTWATQDVGASVMLTIDHHTAEILRIHAVKCGARWKALEQIFQPVASLCQGNLGAGRAGPINVRLSWFLCKYLRSAGRLQWGRAVPRTMAHEGHRFKLPVQCRRKYYGANVKLVA